jgi:hypothetical protein
MSKTYVTASVQLTRKTVILVDKLAAEYGVSRAKLLSTLVEWALHEHGENVEQSKSWLYGAKNQYNRAKTVAKPRVLL